MAYKGEISLKRIGKLTRQRMDKDYDLVYAITGDEGSGKSTLADQLGKEIDPKFTITKNTVTAIEFDKIKSTALDPKVKVLIFDEAIKSFYKLTWASKLQVSLNRLFSTVRQERKCFMLCIPRFTDLSEFFRNHRCKIWIHIDKRGLGLVFMKSRNFFAKSGWNMEDYEKRVEKWIMRRGEQYTTNELVDFLNKEVPIFMGYLLFDPLSPEEKEEYNSVIAQAKYEGIEADLKQSASGFRAEDYYIARERLGMILKRFKQNQIPLLKEYKAKIIASLIDADPKVVDVYISYYDKPQSIKYGQPKLIKHNEPSRDTSQDVHAEEQPSREHDQPSREDELCSRELKSDKTPQETIRSPIPQCSRELHVNIKPSREGGVKVGEMPNKNQLPLPIIYNNNRSTKNSTKPLISRHSSDFVYQNTKKKPKKVKK
jgi:adenylate kinase family enzyme